MKRYFLKCLTFVFAIIFFMSFSVYGSWKVGPEFSTPSVPGLRIGYKNMYLGSTYDFGEKEVYYKLGGKYNLGDDISLSGDYNYWLNYELPDYLYEEGVRLEAEHERGFNENMGISIFIGQVGKELSKAIEEEDYYFVGYIFDYWWGDL